MTLKGFCAAVALALLMVAGTEVFWRSRGMTPSVPDTAALWVHEYRAAVAEPGRKLAVLGSSRAILGIDPEVVEDSRLEADVHQLGIYGSSPLEVLRHLAEDTDFDGLAIVELSPIVYLDSGGSADALPKAYIEARNQQPVYMAFEVKMRAYAHALLATRRAALTPLELVRSWRYRGQLPQAEHIQILPNRHARADFSLASVDDMIDFRLGHFRRTYKSRPNDGHLEVVKDLVGWAEVIKDRGGRVLFLEMPSEEATAALEASSAPAALYWDLIATALPDDSLRCLDIPTLQDFRCADESHLDAKDAPAFSLALFNYIRDQGLLPQSWQVTK